MMHYHCDRCEKAAQQNPLIDVHKQDYLHCEGIDITSPDFDLASWATKFDKDCICEACTMYLGFLMYELGTREDGERVF